MLKASPLVHYFLNVLLLKSQIMTSVRTTLKTLVWSAQNWSISIEIIPENNHKIGLFYRLIFSKVCPENCRKIGRFFREFATKNPPNLTFFCDLSVFLMSSSCQVRGNWLITKPIQLLHSKKGSRQTKKGSIDFLFTTRPRLVDFVKSLVRFSTC